MAARTMTSVNLPGNNGERKSVGWRLISCAQFGAAPRRGLFRKLGSRGQKAFFFSASFESKVRRPVATSMCSQNKVDRDDMDRSPPLSQNQPLHHIHQPQQLQPSRWLTLPTILTLGRVVAVPLLICTFYMNGWWGTTATTSIFIVAAITDWLDGYIARKMRLGTAFGAFLDPVADKLMVAATLVLLCNRPLGVAVFGDLPWLLTVPSIVIIGREITMSAVREWAASQNNRVLEAVAVNNLGKWKTATQMTALTILLATRDSRNFNEGSLVSAAGLLSVEMLLMLANLVIYEAFIETVFGNGNINM